MNVTLKSLLGETPQQVKDLIASVPDRAATSRQVMTFLEHGWYELPLSQVKKGEHVRRIINHEASRTVYIRGDYDRASKRYSLQDTEDMNREIFLAGKTQVVIGFTY
jgi:hypothetical protein